MRFFAILFTCTYKYNSAMFEISIAFVLKTYYYYLMLSIVYRQQRGNLNYVAED
ncbi:hypothetical protein [Spiroplasma endosymbiont of Asaphidion curtum]|uniref:hypothetical protein n=1 Tax=Spiroplasma endosymbiont of Asaphidion curtum TaxID=3066281 RepID=UPI00313B7D6B